MMYRIMSKILACSLIVLLFISNAAPVLAFMSDFDQCVLTESTIESYSEENGNISEYATSGFTYSVEPELQDAEEIEEQNDELYNEPITTAQTSLEISPFAVAGTLGSQPIGTTVKLKVNGMDRDFIVVQHGKPSAMYDMSWDGATILLMKTLYNSCTFHDTRQNDYANSSVHSFINDQFVGYLDEDVKNALLTLKIPYRPGNGSGTNVLSGADGLPAKVFFLSASEVGFTVSDYSGIPIDGAKFSYFEYGNTTAAKNIRRTTLNSSYTFWFLRTPTTNTGSNTVLGVNTDGAPIAIVSPDVAQAGTRPALALSSASMVDENGNISVDTAPSTPPSITVPDTIAYDSEFTVLWGASTSVSGTFGGYQLERQLNGGEWTQIYQGAATSFSQTFTRDQADAVNYRVRAYSTGGLLSEYATGTARTVINNMAPTLPGSVNTDMLLVNSWEKASISYTWTASSDENGDPIIYYIEKCINNGSWTQVATADSASYSHTVSADDNTVQIRVSAYDNREYSGYSTSAITSIIHDTSSPSISLVAAPDSDWTASDVVITVVAANALSPLDKLVAPDGVTPSGIFDLSGNTATMSFTADSIGVYTFAVYNKAGLCGTDSITVGNVDQTPPNISYITSVQDGEFTNQDVDIHFTLSDELSGIKRLITPTDSLDLSGSSANYTYTMTQNGSPSFTLLDNVFNSVSANIIINIIDRNKPVATVDSGLKQWHNNASALLQIGASDDYSGISNITLPDGSLHNGDSTDFEIIENGVYTVRATDRAGNVSDTASLNYELFDRTPPIITSLRFEETNQGLFTRLVSLFNNDIVTNKQIKMIVAHDDTPNGNDAKSGVECINYRVCDHNGNPLEDWIITHVDDPVPYIGYEVNGYVEVQVTDKAGNSSEIEKYTILLDVTAPAVSYELNESDVTNLPVIVTLIGEDETDGSGFKGFILPDGGALVPQNEIQYTFYDNGSRTFIGCDNAGNQVSVTVTVSNIKNMPPVVDEIIIEKTGNGLIRSLSSFFGQAYNEQVKVTIAVTDTGPATVFYCVTPDAEIPDDIVWSEAYGGILYFDMEMTGVIHAKAVDIAGNWSNTKSRALILDATPPNLTATIAPRENDFEPCIINVLAEDNSSVAGISGVAGITLPTGEFSEQNSIEYTVKENGVFVFKAIDNAGNESTETVVIDYIRPVLLNDWENNMPVINAVLHAVGKHNIADIKYSDLLNLRYLDLSAKGLESLPDILGYGQNIARLDLRGNEFVTIPECVFRLKNLSYLDLSNNNLIDVDEKIATLGALDYLDVSLNYLVDYDCPIVVDTYRDIGNFTYTNRAGQYFFEFAPHGYGKEYIGNTVQMSVRWRCGDDELQEPLEEHRKALYRKYYGEYKTYRPLIYSYSTSIGELKAQTPDYARIYLPGYGIMKIGMTVGTGGDTPPVPVMSTQSNDGISAATLNMLAVNTAGIYTLASSINSSLSNIEALSESVEVFALPAPEIQEIDVTRGVIVVDAGKIDENIRTDLKAIVEISDENGTVLALSEAKVPDNKLCEVPVAIVLLKGHIITVRLANNEFSGEYVSDVNQQTPMPSNGGGSSSELTEYVIVEREIEKKVLIEVERISEKEFINDGKADGFSNSDSGENSANKGNASNDMQIADDDNSDPFTNHTVIIGGEDGSDRSSDLNGDYDSPSVAGSENRNSEVVFAGFKKLLEIASTNKTVQLSLLLILFVSNTCIILFIKKRKREAKKSAKAKSQSREKK